jgi:hypothetical protein
MQALVRGSTNYGSDPSLNSVDSELDELGRCGRIKPVKRQRLLQVIHASRALDTCLSAVLRGNGVQPNHGIGKMLDQLKALPPRAKGYMDHPAVTNFKSAIAYKRNRYAHAAGTFPTSTKEVDDIVSEIHSCLSVII